MKTAIIYVSVHHGNTRKIAEAAAKETGADLFELTGRMNLSDGGLIDLPEYELVGLASGVFYHGLHERMKEFIRTAKFGDGQKVYIMATCGIAYRDYTKGAEKEIKARGADCIGSFQCRGYDTFGPFGKIGGIAKGHPSEKDIRNAVLFVRRMIDSSTEMKQGVMNIG